MWKRCRYWILLLALLGVALAVYFEPSHCVRGWLWGEAFFDGRPTSYWRPRCDEWLERWDKAEDAVGWIPPGTSAPFIDQGFLARSWIVMPKPRRAPTFWTELADHFRSDDERLNPDWPPKVLFGYPGAEPVLEELAKDARYEPVVKRSLQYAKIYRDVGHTK